MSKHLTQRLIKLRRFSLATKAFPELGFDHAKGSLYVRAFVVMSKKLIPVEVVEVKQAGPC